MYESEYQRKRCTPEDAAGWVKSGDTIFVPGGALTPLSFAKALYARKDELEHVRMLNYLPLAALDFLMDPECKGHFDIQSLFYSGPQRIADDHGFCDVVPVHLRNAARDWGEHVPEYDVMVITVSPMDKHGYFTMAGSSLVEWQMMKGAKKLVLEVASRAPRTYGDTLIHISQVDALYEVDRHPCVLPNPAPTHEDELLGGYVAELVNDGDTIQLGFGGTINALAGQLKNKHDLGMHTEAFSDAAMELMECGAVNNSRKTLYPRQVLTSFTMGSERLYDYVDDNMAILHRSLAYTNDPRVISQNRNMVSINATLQMDLMGQCASEAIGIKQYSGAGGQVDTAIGAQMAEGGRSIITVRSTYTVKDRATGEKKLCSRIVPRLSPSSVVTLTRNNVHFVASEYGVVCLRGLTLAERAKALISIAHPDFRPWLEEEYQKIRYGAE